MNWIHSLRRPVRENWVHRLRRRVLDTFGLDTPSAELLLGRRPLGELDEAVRRSLARQVAEVRQEAQARHRAIVARVEEQQNRDLLVFYVDGSALRIPSALRPAPPCTLWGKPETSAERATREGMTAVLERAILDHLRRPASVEQWKREREGRWTDLP